MLSRIQADPNSSVLCDGIYQYFSEKYGVRQSIPDKAEEKNMTGLLRHPERRSTFSRSSDISVEQILRVCLRCLNPAGLITPLEPTSSVMSVYRCFLLSFCAVTVVVPLTFNYFVVTQLLCAMQLGIYTGLCYPLIVLYIILQCNGDLNEMRCESGFSTSLIYS